MSDGPVPRRPFGAPAPRALRDWQHAEEIAVEWVRWLGHPDAALTPPGADSGVDVTAPDALAQVKFRDGIVGRPAIQQLLGADEHQGRALYFFSVGGYSDAALTAADQCRIACFTFDYATGISPANVTATDRLHAAEEAHRPAPPSPEQSPSPTDPGAVARHEPAPERRTATPAGNTTRTPEHPPLLDALYPRPRTHEKSRHSDPPDGRRQPLATATTQNATARLAAHRARNISRGDGAVVIAAGVALTAGVAFGADHPTSVPALVGMLAGVVMTLAGIALVSQSRPHDRTSKQPLAPEPSPPDLAATLGMSPKHPHHHVPRAGASRSSSSDSRAARVTKRPPRQQNRSARPRRGGR